MEDDAEDEEYFFEEEKQENNKSKKEDIPTFNPKCRCPELSCPRHANCKECQAFHHKRYETSYCGK